MKVSQMLDDIEQLAMSKVTRELNIDRFMLLDWMSAELNELTSKAEWDWAMQHINPILATRTGVRVYTLPDDFPDNFVRYGGGYGSGSYGESASAGYGTTTGQGWVCVLDDGTNEIPLAYISPAKYFSQNIRNASNSRPTHYTIMSNSRGQKEIHLFPPPDANGSTGYTIDGVYIPTDWALDEERDLPPIPANSQVLKYAVLRRVDPQRWEAAFRESYSYLMMRAANQRKAQIVPVKGHYLHDSYTLMRRG